MNLTLIQIISLISLSYAVKIKLNVYPKPDDPKSSLIWYNSSTEDSWSQKLDNYLEVYRAPLFRKEVLENMIDCDHDHPSTEDKACTVNTEKFNPCVVTNYFGYKAREPCVFIELQKVDGWIPKYYNDTKDLPSTMPKHLRNKIELETQEPYEWENIWISCEGDTAADKELIGFVHYYPIPGFPGYMLPYSGQKYYLNPTVAVQFKQANKIGIVVNIICKVWGPGIKHDVKNSIGAVSFQILDW